MSTPKLFAPFRLDPGVPQTLQQMIEIQVECLSGEERGLLAAARVTGQRFSAWAVGAITNSSTLSIGEVLYAQLPSTQRRRLHVEVIIRSK